MPPALTDGLRLGPSTMEILEWRVPASVTLTADDTVVVSRFASDPDLMHRHEGRILRRFTSLVDANAEAVRRFVASYGPIGLWPDGGGGYFGRRFVEVKAEGTMSMSEPVSGYRHLAAVVAVVQRIAPVLRDGRRADEHDVVFLERHLFDEMCRFPAPVFDPFDARKSPPGHPGRLAPGQVMAATDDYFGTMRAALGETTLTESYLGGEVLGPRHQSVSARHKALVAGVIGWMALCGDCLVGYQWRASSRVLEQTLEPRGLWTSLIAQLVDELRDANGWGVCAGCGGPLGKRQRAPKRGQRAWCDTDDCRRLRHKWEAERHHAKRARRRA